jgi:hypothetical protein
MSPPENKEEGLKRGLVGAQEMSATREGTREGMSCSDLATRSAFHACFCAAFPHAVQLRNWNLTFSASRRCLLPASSLLACVIALES